MKKTHGLCAAFAVLLGILAMFTLAKASNERSPEVRVYDTKNLHLDVDFFAFQNDFKGGVNIAAGDLNGDGVDELIAAPRVSGGPQVRIFDKTGKWTGISFFAFEKEYKGGVSVAAGDVDGDKRDEIIVSKMSKSSAWIKVYESDGKSIIKEFLAFDRGFMGGVNVATGDINGDGKDEIIAGSGKNGSHVRVFDKNGKYLGWDVFPFGKDFKGGVNVASANVDSDKKDEIIVSQASRGQAWVKVYKANAQKYVVSNFMAFPADFKGGATVTGADVDNDGAAEIVVGAGMGGGPQVRTFETDGRPSRVSFFPFEKEYRGGVGVAVAKFSAQSPAKIVAAPLGRYSESAQYPYAKYIEINISEQKIKYFENGDKIDEFYISTGTWGFPTPVGTFSVSSKVSAARMTGFYGEGNPNNYDLPGVPWVMSFYGPYTIHGTYWHNNFGNRMSHGCVNLPTPKAYELYMWADIGTPVVVHY